MDPVTLAKALIERLPTCCTVKLPQFARTGKATETPAALAEMSKDVSTAVNVVIDTAFKYWLLVIKIVSARFRLMPLKDVS